MAHKDHRSSSGGGWLSPAKIALYVFLSIAAFFLFTEHLAHLVPVLPWLFTRKTGFKASPFSGAEGDFLEV
ncbi:MAG: DUF2933 domain-containing protein [Kamptonema sp. SIO1D9]|nr:DUF2933 domain-containing protein [Kamptonema sp. SIO1D9]